MNNQLSTDQTHLQVQPDQMRQSTSYFQHEKRDLVEGTSQQDGDQRQALIVFLENIGYIHGLSLPQWTQNLIDFVLEEYAKIALRWHGVYRHYDQVIILEDADATGQKLADALKMASRTHIVDVMLLVHGHQQCLVGYKGKEMVGKETFGPLLRDYKADPSLLNLRMIFGVNCFGASLAPVWLELGAKVANGALGVNWLPEPSISIFLHHWLRGHPFSQAIGRSNQIARNWGNRVLASGKSGSEHPAIASSRQTIYGISDLTIHST
ncbi:MAG: hypothetical protein AAF702_41715 [Chloroflexota bacterium]